MSDQANKYAREQNAMHKILIAVPSNIGDNIAKTVVMANTACLRALSNAKGSDRKSFEKDGCALVVVSVLDTPDIEKIEYNAKKNGLNACALSAGDCGLHGDQKVAAVGPHDEAMFNKLSANLRLFGR